MESGTTLHLALLKKTSTRPQNYRSKHCKQEITLFEDLECIDNLEASFVPYKAEPLPRQRKMQYQQKNEENITISAWNTDSLIENNTKLRPRYFAKPHTETKQSRGLNSHRQRRGKSEENKRFFSGQKLAVNQNAENEYYRQVRERLENQGKRGSVNMVNITYGENEMHRGRRILCSISPFAWAVDKALLMKGKKACSFNKFLESLSFQQRKKGQVSR